MKIIGYVPPNGCWHKNLAQNLSKGSMTMKQVQIAKINSYAEYQKKMVDYENHIKMMVGTEGNPIPLNVMIVSGDKGVGKSYTADRILETQSTRPYFKLTGSITPVQFYQVLWQNNDAIIALDDTNPDFFKAASALLKACTETKTVRKMNWQKQNHNCIPVNKYKLGDNKAIADMMDKLVEASGNNRLSNAHASGNTFPDSFYFTGAILILTNKPLAFFDQATDGAVSNRGWHQEMLFNLNGAIDMLKHFGPQLSEFNTESVAMATKFLTSKNAMQYYKNTGKIPTIRNLIKIVNEHDAGLTLDDDTLVNNTEYPAY